MSTVKAKESRQIHTARKKIKQQLDSEARKMNREALTSMRQNIQKQLARHQPERIDLKERMFTLFDENKHPAKTESRFVSKLLKQLQNKTKKLDKDLEGRIKQI